MKKGWQDHSGSYATLVLIR